MPTFRVPKKLNADALWEYALRSLASRAHSTGELRQKLARRAESSADVAATISKLRDYGLADDTKFSEAYAASRLHNQGFGQLRVLQDLRGKQVASGVAEQAVKRAFDGTDECALAAGFLERKYRSKNLREFLAEEKNLASAYRRLRTAGFSSNAAMTVLKRYANRADLDEPFEEAAEE